MSGQIKVTRDFVFKDGEEFDLKIRVTDSDQWGKTENTASFKFISRDDCKDIRVVYNEAVKLCTIKTSSDSEPSSCSSVQCLKSLYKWQEALNASEKYKVGCSFDPYNIAAVLQKPGCTGKSRVTLVSHVFIVKSSSTASKWEIELIFRFHYFSNF